MTTNVRGHLDCRPATESALQPELLAGSFHAELLRSDRHRGRAPTTEMNQLGRRDASAVHHYFVIGGLKAAEPRRPTYGRASRRSTAAAAAGGSGGPRANAGDAAAAGGHSKRRGRHSPSARTGRRASFPLCRRTRHTPHSRSRGATPGACSPLGECRPPGAVGPPLPPQAGARAARRWSSREPFVACPRAA